MQRDKGDRKRKGDEEGRTWTPTIKREREMKEKERGRERGGRGVKRGGGSVWEKNRLPVKGVEDKYK